VIIGPVVLINYQPKSEYADTAKALDLNLDDLYNSITDVKLTSFNSMLSVVELIEDVGNYLIKAAYKTQAAQIDAATVKLDKLDRLLRYF